MGEVVQAVTDTKDPNWGMPAVSSSVSSDTKDPNWGLAPAKSQAPSSSGALALRGAAAAVPLASSAALGLATSPTAAKTIGALANAGTTLAGVVHGTATGNIPEIIASPIAGWQAGKGGFWLGKRIQEVAGPIARAGETLAPYAQAISTASGAQGVLDLAQMADKTRRDIGFLGMGHTVSDADVASSVAANKANQDKAEAAFQALGGKQMSWSDLAPAAVKAIADKIGDLSAALKRSGVPAPDAHAVKLVSDGNPTIFGRLLNLYMQAK